LFVFVVVVVLLLLLLFLFLLMESHFLSVSIELQKHFSKSKITERYGKKILACLAAHVFSAFLVPPKFFACSYNFNARLEMFLLFK